MLDVQSQGIPVEPLEAVPGQVDQCQVVHVTKGIRGQLHYLILVQVNLKMINIYVKTRDLPGECSGDQKMMVLFHIKTTLS